MRKAELNFRKEFLEVDMLKLDINDWLNTANIVENLSIIVTADTAMAHLCGAMDKMCIVILNKPCEWRWGQSGSNCKLYNKLLLARCKIINNWDSGFIEADRLIKYHYQSIISI